MFRISQLFPLLWKFKMPGLESSLVVVLGSTGVGKSKLALEVAKHFRGEIINADSMQVYKGLDIVTNKVSSAEKEGIPHHLMDFLSATDNYTVREYQKACLETIDDIHARGCLPVIVGGTNYYIESVLWKVLLDDSALRTHTGSGQNTADCAAVERRLSAMTCSERYELLQSVDPQRAAVLHPGNRRAIYRALEVYLKSGEPMSAHLTRQRNAAGAHRQFGGGLRFERVCLLWLTCGRPELQRRLDERVDQMLARGLLVELADFHAIYSAQQRRTGLAADYTHGVFQSIGLKEFHDYLTRSADEDDASVLVDAVRRMKTATRRYARYQEKWVRRRFLCTDRQVPSVYRLDATDLDLWDSNVLNPALEVVYSFLEGRESKRAPEPRDVSVELEGDMVVRYCEVCNLHTAGSEQHSIHMKSVRHKKSLRHKRRLELKNAPWV